MLRTRWAAIGAAVAVCLGAGGLGLVHATSPSNASAFVPITPCRIVDTRPAFLVGDRATPLGANETYNVNGWGAVGNCESAAALPSGSSGLQLNVTATSATLSTFLTLFPKGATLPVTSNLNPGPGQPPTPNAVTVTLNSTDGQFSIYNLQGTVDVIIDVVGYYTNHTHDDRYYTKAQVDTALDALRNQTITITGRELMMTGHGDPFNPDANVIGTTSGCAVLYNSRTADLPLRIPNGATITKVSVDLLPNAAWILNLVRLVDKAGGGQNGMVIGSAFGTAAPGSNIQVDLTPTSETVDLGESFILNFDDGVASSGAGLCSATISYRLAG